MEALIVLLVLFLVCIVFVFPIWAFIRIRSQADELSALRKQMDAVESDLRRRPAASRATPAAAEAAVPSTPPVALARPPPAPSGVKLTRLPEMPAPVVEQSLQIPPPLAAPSLAATGYVQHFPPPRPRAPAFNWEQFMGVKLFLWLGGFALFLGAVFFVKLSIEQGWLPPEVRVALGFLLGAGLVAGGMILSRKRFAFQAQTLCATGIVTLYAMTTICTPDRFGYLSAPMVLGLMVLITTTAFFLAIRLNAQVVALLGMFGGFLTPILLSTGHDNAIGLFTYIALLDVGLIAVALHRRWHFLVPLAALGTGLMQVGWAATFLTREKTDTAMLVCLAFNALFLAGFIFARSRKQASRLFSLPVAALALLSFFFAGYLGLETQAGLQPVRWLGFVFLADVCVLALVLFDVSTARLHVFAGMVVFALLGAWTLDRVNLDLLPWALGGYLVYAALHSAFPLVLHRLRPDAPQDRWSSLFTPLAMILVLGPVFTSSTVSSAIWPAILLLDLFAIALAWATASFVSVVALLILSLVAAGQSFFRIPASESGGFLLLIIAGLAILFFSAGVLLARKFQASAATAAGDPEKPPAFSAQLPALAALLPFILLVMATARFSLPSPEPVFGLALLLVALTLSLARLLGQGALPSCGLAGVLALSYAWQAEHFRPESASTPLLWYTGFYAIFLVFPFLFHRAFLERRGPWIASAAAGPLFFPLVFSVIKNAWPNDVMGLLPLAFAIPALGCVAAILRLDPAGHPRRLGRLALFGGIALLFITLILPIQFDRQWITIGWALEGVAVLWLFHRVPHRGLPVAGFLLLGTAFARLALNPAVLSYSLQSGISIFNGYLYSYGTVVLCLLGGARLLFAPRNRLLGIDAPAWLHTLAGILLFFLVNIEIADYFGGRRTRLVFNFSSGSFPQDMSYTIAWSAFAFALLIVGVWKTSRAARYSALGLLTVSIAKLLLHDLARLGGLYRVGALMIVAVIAILASFVYQRFLPPEENKPSAAP